MVHLFFLVNIVNNTDDLFQMLHQLFIPEMESTWS